MEKFLKIKGYMTKADLILIIILVSTSIMGMGIMARAGSNYSRGYVVIKANSNEVKKISMEENSDSKIYEFLFDDKKGYIETKGMKVRMLEMDKSICPSEICSETGWIEKEYDIIVCLPNKITVEFEGKSNEEIDLISY